MDEQKLLCLIALSDRYARQLTNVPGEAFFRAFIVEERRTGVVSMNFRFRYEKSDSWYHVSAKPGQSSDEAFVFLRGELIRMVRETADRLGVALREDDVRCFEPPDDEGNPWRTVQWLHDRELIAQITVKPVPN